MNFANVKELTIPEGDVLSITDMLGTVLWQKQGTGPDLTEPFYAENLTNSPLSINFYKYYSSAPTVTVWYSRDKSNWTQLGQTTSADMTLTISPNEKVWFVGLSDTNQQWANDNYNNRISFSSKIGGNIMSLVYGQSFNGQTEFSNLSSTKNFYSLFSSTNITDISELILPAKQLTVSCYHYMFSYCANITVAPIIYALYLDEYSCAYMFSNCPNLETGPTLLAQTIPTPSKSWSGAYYEMFYNCTKLNYVKCLATTLGTHGTDYWMNGVASAGTFVKDANTTWERSVHGIPSGWTVENA